MELYEPLHQRLNRFVHSMVWNSEDARDIISETVLIAYESFDKVEQPESFLYYLFSIASRLAKKRERRKKYWVVLGSEQVESIPSPESGESTVMLWELNAALDKLPIKQRETITLFEISGFSIKEIAKMQGSTESGVKSRLVRARKALAILLEKEKTPRAVKKYLMGFLTL